SGKTSFCAFVHLEPCISGSFTSTQRPPCILCVIHKSGKPDWYIPPCVGLTYQPLASRNSVIACWSFASGLLFPLKDFGSIVTVNLFKDALDGSSETFVRTFDLSVFWKNRRVKQQVKVFPGCFIRIDLRINLNNHFVLFLVQ